MKNNSQGKASFDQSKSEISGEPESKSVHSSPATKKSEAAVQTLDTQKNKGWARESASSRSRSRGNSLSAKPASPRRQTYEAKFDKFLANKSIKEDKELRAKAMKKEDFDVVTRNSRSPNKRSKNF